MIAKNPTSPPSLFIGIEALKGLARHILARLGKSDGHIPHSRPFYFLRFFIILHLRFEAFEGTVFCCAGGARDTGRGTFGERIEWAARMQFGLGFAVWELRFPLS